ncbi:MAG TPA: Nramp family divalent metal transporter [Syntrophales bacterium]|jgi:Mn2+/Fe2+ NRAMP family transporter|nr:Nramp family divalent metal transporter [Syntrophales bacterium]HOU78371.1 Nramp family divalent metal transporter [Syntrophales bacterium]HPC33173.1 Nramp family divalent metal transporter [Syntrophales bacterium]HQG34540.1 Nramp family divalent metal transporter [Syntrophales bacterium]HQI36059.1 Nramp family divalent metal transporter [Syntrophales bacterium]
MAAGVSEKRKWPGVFQRLFSRRWWRSLGLLFALIGPGIITSNVDNDAGGITTYSLAGAQYGLSLLWTLIPITVALIIIQEMCARMGVVSGKGLSDLIRERFGAKITVYLMMVLFLANLGNTISEFAGIAASLEIFGVGKYVSVPVGAFFVWWLVVKGNYKSVEKVFLVACLFYVSYIISGFMGKPDWGRIGIALVTPTVSSDPAFLTMAVGVVGTTIAPWMQFYLQSSVVDKGLKAEDYAYTRVDIIVGSLTVNVVAFFIIMLCAVTLFQQGIKIETAKDAAQALAPLAGNYCTYLFAFGLLNASLFAASILPLSTAYTICEAFGWESSLNRKFTEAPQFYGLYSLMIVLGAAIILLPNMPLIGIMYYSQVINGLLLPFILIFMLILINDSRIMGDYVNGRTMNIITWLTVGILILLSLAIVVTSLLP